jgi:hypothetical protein
MLDADPIGVSLRKLRNQPRYITLWYFPEEANTWAARLDELATALVNPSGGKQVDASRLAKTPATKSSTKQR